MIERTINGKRKLCYLLKKGEKNDIVIPFDSLADIDVKRMHEMDSQGGELMRVMRDTKLDNGNNALAQYKDLIRSVPVKQAAATAEPAPGGADAAPSKRGRGRPKGSKNKKSA